MERASFIRLWKSHRAFGLLSILAISERGDSFLRLGALLLILSTVCTKTPGSFDHSASTDQFHVAGLDPLGIILILRCRPLFHSIAISWASSGGEIPCP